MKTFFSGPALKNGAGAPAVLLGALAVLLPLHCYSAEFFPVAEYPNLRGEFDAEPELRYTPPRRNHRELGSLLVRNYSGELRDETFQAFLKREIKKRGAQGGWINRRRYYNQVHYETGTVNRQRPGAVSPTGEISGRVGTITVILYNYFE